MTQGRYICFLIQVDAEVRCYKLQWDMAKTVELTPMGVVCENWKLT